MKRRDQWINHVRSARRDGSAMHIPNRRRRRVSKHECRPWFSAYKLRHCLFWLPCSRSARLNFNRYCRRGVLVWGVRRLLIFPEKSNRWLSRGLHGARRTRLESRTEEEKDMDVRDYVGPSRIKYQDVVDAPRRETIVEVEKGSFDCLEIKFASGDLLSLNKTNARTLARAYGWESDNWVGKIVQLYAGETIFEKQTQQSVLVKPLSPADAHVDDVPF
jgi:hypothetical protein